MKLVIVESPNKVEKIGGYLGADYRVMASVGHIRDLPKQGIGIAAPDYRLAYELTDRGRGIVERLKSAAARADGVYLATDPDREGEAISWHLKDALGLKTYHRVTFNSITKEAILAAMKAPRQIDDHLVQAQEARRALDRLVGYRVSSALSDQVGSRLSAGRVQSPAVGLVVEREREIAAFRETKHFAASVSFDCGAWSAKWVTKPHLTEGSEYLLDKALAERAASCRNFTVAACDTKLERKAPPPPFTTSGLLQAASVSLKLKSEQAMDAAQKLFEQGHITYHRTDSQNLSGEAIELIRGLATEKGWELPENPRTRPSKDGAQEAHEAIRPTHFDVEIAGEDAMQKGLYRLIRQRAVACQLADAEYSATTMDLDAENDGTMFQFQAHGTVLTKRGWKALMAKDAAEEGDGEGGESGDEADGGKVPPLEVGRAKTADSGKLLEKKTRPPVRYTEASLIKKMEALGIGRPSTFAATIAKIMERGYVIEQKRFLAATATGFEVVDGLRGRFNFIEYTFTKEVEESLDDIACGKATYIDVVRRLDDALTSELAATCVKYPCPECGRALLRRDGKFGAFWSCTSYEAGCAITCTDDNGKLGAVRKPSDSPSEKQLALAEKLASETGESIPDDARINPKALGEWIDKQFATKRAKRAASPASESQMTWVRKKVEEGAKPPPGWPDAVSMTDAKEFLDREFDKKGKGNTKPAAAKKSRSSK